MLINSKECWNSSQIAGFYMIYLDRNLNQTLLIAIPILSRLRMQVRSPTKRDYLPRMQQKTSVSYCLNIYGRTETNLSGPSESTPNYGKIS